MKYVFFSDGTSSVVKSIAAHLADQGYSPILNGIDVSIPLLDKTALSAYLANLGEDFCGAVFDNPAPIRASIEDATDEQWSKARDEFAAPALAFTQCAGDALSALGRGGVVYLNSIHAEKPIGEGFLHTVCCAAVQMLCREAAIRYGKSRVGFYNVMRGILQGEEDLFASEYTAIHHNAHYRFPSEDVPPQQSLDELVAFLLTPAAYILNGTDMHADEGFRLYFGTARK